MPDLLQTLSGRPAFGIRSWRVKLQNRFNSQNVMRIRIVCRLFIILICLTACTHPLEIEGDGDIVQKAKENNSPIDVGCMLEEQPCNVLIGGEYNVRYTAIPRPGWAFESWSGCPNLVHYSYADSDCDISVEKSVVQQWWFKVAPPLVAQFAPIDDRVRSPITGLVPGGGFTIYDSRGTPYEPGFTAASSIGDVNSDGRGDIAVIKKESISTYSLSILYGGEQIPDDGELDIRQQSDHILVISPGETYKWFSEPSPVGDIDGDGFDDFVIHARYRADGSRNTVLLFWGGLSVTLDRHTRILADAPEAYNAIRATRNIGDLNADGFDDLLVYSFDTDRKTVMWIILGKPDFHDAEEITLDDTDIEGTVRLRAEYPNDNTGIGVDGIGDFNGDGVDDLLIGAPNFAEEYYNESSDDYVFESKPGSAYVVYGHEDIGDTTLIELGELDGSSGFIVREQGSNGSGIGYDFGYPVSGLGDVNGDGLNDILIGSGRYSQDNIAGHDHIGGHAQIIFGSATAGELIATDIKGAIGFELYWPSSYHFRPTASGKVDFNNDGLSDVLFAIPGANRAAGELYVFYGASTFEQDEYNLQDLNNSEGLIIDGYHGSEFGRAVNALGDFNGDGVDDIHVVTDNERTISGRRAGYHYVIYGQ